MLARHLTPALRRAAAAYPVVTLTGPRQSGKTTLVRAEFGDHLYVTLEAPDVRMRALEDPRSLLAQSDHMVIDEIQRAPDLLSYIQVLVDEDRRAGRFIVTGSHNLLLMKSVAQTLAGRTAVLTLHPLSLAELQGKENIDAANLDRIDATGWAPPNKSLWETLVTGFYPYIHDRQVDAGDWLANYFRTYVERDLREVERVSDLPTFENFVRLAAARTGQELNLSALANDVGVTQQTIRRWLNALQVGFLVTTLPPHFASYRKRVRKRPRLHFLDSGLACYLLGIRDAGTLERHPLRGSIFESFVVAELVKHITAVHHDAPLYHWRDATGHEIDVLIDAGDRLIPVEVKSGGTIAATACDTVNWWTSLPGNPNRGGVLVHGGDRSFDFKGVRVLPWFMGG